MISIIQKKQCSGCTACYSVCPTSAIDMKKDNEGFAYPVVDKSKCINCGKCDKTCPILNKGTRKSDNKFQAKCYACYNKDETIRLSSSSGGIFSLLANTILEKNGTVFGAAFEKNYNVEHIGITDKKDLFKLRTSKYVQSIMGNCYKETKNILENGSYVLFTGTPCQIEGLLKYLNKRYEKLYTQDFICHGVPSPDVWNKYIASRVLIDNDKICSINFRNKKECGWHNFNLTINYKNKIYSKSVNEDIYLKCFLRNICLRPSCYECSFRKKVRMADITLADCWGVNKYCPKMDDNKGTSAVIVNTKKGEELFNKIENDIVKEEISINHITKYNSAIVKSPKKPIERESYISRINEKQFEEITAESLPKEPIKTIFKKKLKKYIRRALRKE